VIILFPQYTLLQERKTKKPGKTLIPPGRKCYVKRIKYR